MKLKYFLLLIFLNLSFAQNKYDFDQFVNEGKDYITAPLKWQPKDLLLLGLTVGATFGAMQFDSDVKQLTQNGRCESSPIPIVVGRYYGELVTPLLLSSYFIINGNSTGNRFQKQLGFEIAQATFYATATTQVIKMILGRERPARTDDKSNFTWLSLFDNDFWSLPSGHTTVAFAVSTVLSENSSSDILKILAFAPAVLTAYSRVYENRHWLSDVVLGGIIGYTTAKYFVKAHKDKEFQEFVAPTPIYSISISLNKLGLK